MISLNVPGFRIWTAESHELWFTLLLTTDPATSAWSFLHYEAWHHLVESIQIFFTYGTHYNKTEEHRQKTCVTWRVLESVDVVGEMCIWLLNVMFV